MDYSTALSLAISIVGFVTTISTLSRKMITKDDIKTIEDKLDELTERNTNTEKKMAVMEYKIEELFRKVGM